MASTNDSYLKYQNVLDLKINKNKDSSIKRPNINRQRKKSKNGCLNCKRRKKKCDEEKPVCKACVRIKVDCQWPDHVNQLPNDTANNIIRRASVQDLINVNEFSLLDDDFILDQFLDMKSANIILSDRDLDTEYNNRNSNQTIILSNMNTIPGVKLSRNDLLRYHAFIEFLETLLTYPHAHRSLTPSAIILPYVAKYKVVREVALVCGTSWLAYYDASYDDEVTQRYNKVLSLIIKELRYSKADYSDHIFVCAQLLQALCLLDRNFGFNITLCAAHSSSSYAIIKKRFLRNTLPESQSDENPCIIRPLTRLLMENFILFYPLNIMMCHSSKLIASVPSPFSFFGRFYHVLNEPVNGHEEDDVWSNHPILGIGLKAYDIATKCCWICRFLKIPISEDDMITYFSLFVETANELKKLSKLLNDSTSLTPSQQEDVHFTRTMLYASLIILKKLCYYETTTIESLQSTVDLLLQEEKSAREINPRGISSVWALFIGASTSTTVEQKKFFSNMLITMADQLHSSFCLKILKYLNIVWNDDIENDYRYVGFDFLFDTSVLDIISI